MLGTDLWNNWVTRFLKRLLKYLLQWCLVIYAVVNLYTSQNTLQSTAMPTSQTENGNKEKMKSHERSRNDQQVIDQRIKFQDSDHWCCPNIFGLYCLCFISAIQMLHLFRGWDLYRDEIFLKCITYIEMSTSRSPVSIFNHALKHKPARSYSPCFTDRGLLKAELTLLWNNV